MTAHNDYDDIPGTTVFDARRSRQGYHLNMFFMSLIKPENRAAFKADEAAYLARYPVSQEQRDAVLARDWNRMIDLGGNIFFAIKLAFCDGLSVQKLAALMTGTTPEAYAKMMQEGGRSVEGNRSKAEWEHGQDHRRG
jgi:protocatechuate 4,5-dioxygenase alpha chain